AFAESGAELPKQHVTLAEDIVGADRLRRLCETKKLRAAGRQMLKANIGSARVLRRSRFLSSQRCHCVEPGEQRITHSQALGENPSAWPSPRCDSARCRSRWWRTWRGCSPARR